MKEYGFDTNCLHGGHTPDAATGSRGVPLYRTSAYMFKDSAHAVRLFDLKELGNIYTRLMNPTSDVLEKRIALLEGGAAALALASGTSAIFYSIITICEQGDEVVASNRLYGGTFTQLNNILPKFGIRTVFVDPSDPENFAKAITSRTKAVYCETIGNPVLDVTDIGRVAQIAHNHNLPLIVDSTFTTPYLLRPMDHGADIVVHSMSKWLGGHGTGIGGIVVDSGKFDWTAGNFPLMNEPDESYHGLRFSKDLGPLSPIGYILRMRTGPLRNLGACIAPDNSWMFLQGVETLHVRMQRHCENAMKIATFLQEHRQVDWVRYPGLEDDPSFPVASRYMKNGFGGMTVFGIKGGPKAGMRFIESLQLFSHLANVGDAKSLAIHPATTTHAQLTEEQQLAGGIRPELIRLSVGIEDADDLIKDLDRALGG